MCGKGWHAILFAEENGFRQEYQMIDFLAALLET